MRNLWISLVAATLVTSCFWEDENQAKGPIDVPDVAVTTPEPTIQRISIAQYVNSIHDLIGEDIVVPSQLEPDVVADGLVSIGMSHSTISPFGVEKYEDAAFKIAQQAIENETYKSKIVSCSASGPGDKTCLKQIIGEFGGRAWRRPLEQEEIDSIAAISSDAATTYSDFDEGVQFALAAILQSPNFLFRVELGEPDTGQSGAFRFTNYEMASRLSYFLTNSTPDDELLEAAANGQLVTDEGVRTHVERLLKTDKAKSAVRNFFIEYYDLVEMDHLSKDPTIFTHMHADLGAAAKEETLLGIEKIVFDDDSDFREFFTTRHTYVDRRLAALYGVPAPAVEGFAEVTLPEDGGRRGFLGQASFLAGQSHPGASSAVLRGKFIRTKLLCGEVPPPPANFNTGVPEQSESARTLRERSEVHYSNDVCASCHALMDPLGLGLENFDAIGQWRELDNGGLIDPAGDLEYSFDKVVEFAGAWDLGAAIAEHPKFGFCIARNLYRYATGAVETKGEFAQLDALGDVFEQSGYRIKELVTQVALSPGFRMAGKVSSE